MKRVDLPSGLSPRARDAHKGSHGTVLCVAGSEGMFGAAILTARGALRGGAGLVRAALPAAFMTPFSIAVPAALTIDRARADFAAGADVVVCGPGLPPDEASALGARLPSELLGVFDAGALHHDTIRHRVGHARATSVWTPHPGEAARLLGCSTAEIQTDRERAVIELFERCGGSSSPTIVVLKGAGTLVFDGDRLYENPTGNPGLGTGGTGDVLAGLLGALLAQGLAPFDAACRAVHVHGAAGDLVARRLSEPGLCAEDLPLAIAEVLGAS